MNRLLLLAFTLSSSLVFGQNLIANGGFENNLTQWQNMASGTGQATFTRETSDVNTGTGALRAQISAIGANAWDVQSIHSGWASSKNTSYTLTFFAKTVGTPAKVRLVQQNQSYAAQEFDITSSWKQYTWTFNAAEDNLQLKIHYYQTGTFLFDDFVILAPSNTITPKTLTVNPLVAHQKMVGFGGALTWHCDRITRSSKKNEIANLLFQDLGTDILRVKNWYYPLNYPTSKSPLTMEVDWFVPHFNATKELASLAKTANPNLDILLSSWGPPSSLKSNGKLEGGTLKKNNGQFVYQEFGQYWKDILDNIAFQPDYISIQNEPGYENAGWTTTAWRPTETADFAGFDKGLEAVYNSISTRSTVPKIIGPETENIGSALWDNSLNTFASMASAVKAKPYLFAYAYHLYNYGSPGNINASLLNMIRDDFSDKPNFMTEFSSTSYDWVQTAHMIQYNLMEANTSAYIYWEMMWDQNSQTAMISVDETGNYKVSPYFYTLKHFSKYIDKGDSRIEVAGSTSTLKATGFINSSKDRITLVVSNNSLVKDSLKLQLGTLKPQNTEVYQSKPDLYFSKLESVDLAKGMEIPAQSISTIVIKIESTIAGLLENQSVSSLSLYPSPAQDVITIVGMDENEKWTLFDSKGYQVSDGNGNEVILKGYKPGLYLIKTKGQVLKFIKNQ